MHLLVATPGGQDDREGVVSLGQTPAQIVFLCAQDTHLGLLSLGAERLPADYPSVRTANLTHLSRPASMDLYLDEVLRHAQVIVASLLGGQSYWPYVVERLRELSQAGTCALVLVPGDDQLDLELMAQGSVAGEVSERIWRYLCEGGADNMAHLYSYLAQQFFAELALPLPPPLPAVPLARAQVYVPEAWRDLSHLHSALPEDAPRAMLIFYRAHLQTRNTDAIDALIEHLCEAGLKPLPVAVASLRARACLDFVNHIGTDLGVILNTTGFAIGGDGASLSADVPVLQVILANSDETYWRESSAGMGASDIAMNVAMPEMDGRIITRAVSFKQLIRRSQLTQSDIIAYQLQPDRARFVAELARRWARLQQLPNGQKRVAILLANYPSRDGRIGNGVGLDTPASTVAALHALADAGYSIADALPPDGTALVQHLLGTVTNDLDQQATRPVWQSLSLADYQRHFAAMPESAQQAVLARWGDAAQDPHVRTGRITIAGWRCGGVFIGVQPSRGYDVDLSASYHDPDLVPPHAYLAYYFWLREHWRCDAIVHFGKHGNLEWLPGKGLALSRFCWPEIALGPMPHLYPFIVNDPGEGAQAKRRAQAVIIDHLMPAMMRAETYGDLTEIESMLDEYYQALGLDARRANYLCEEIVRRARAINLHAEVREEKQSGELLMALDAYLCELKEAQIRDGLHTFGHSPADAMRIDTLMALVRLPRSEAAPGDESLLRALSRDLNLPQDYDPLCDADYALPWEHARPDVLAQIDPSAWRTLGDTRERLEALGRELIERRLTAGTADPSQPAASAVLDRIAEDIAPRLDSCGEQEITQLLRGLAGRFVPPGPSGAPTRGRLDVLPTGRNFYSLDTRAVPTLAAWQLAKLATEALLVRHLQDHGDYPKTLGLSVWGTATMRTGGDDIAQAMALLGVRPRWSLGSGRVDGFEVIPLSLLDRPRVDVTLRVSGFFRDAFPNVIALYDDVVRAVAALPEPAHLNPLRAHVQKDTRDAIEAGLSQAQAQRQSQWRVFGAKPGAYGAGLQGLIDGRNWQDAADLARAYVNWGGYAYGRDESGTEAHETFKLRLSTLDAVLQNQDNREHDLLDSDDYYQFQGGMHNAVSVLSGRRPATYHGDNANPQAPRVRSLQEELQRVIRARVVNPKWLESIRRHGYKGAAEMAATVDYLFSYGATTALVEDYQYEMVGDAYLFDPVSAEFLQTHNPDALREMTERLLEAIGRGLWQDTRGYQEKLSDLLLTLEARAEGAGSA